PLPNGLSGIVLQGGATDNTVGGATSGSGNVISGNGSDGVTVSGVGTTGNAVQGNRIGLDAAGTGALGNGRHGVGLLAGASGNRVGGAADGEGNAIAFNVRDGIFIDGGSGNSLLRNAIHDNGERGTDRPGTGVPNPPAILSASGSQVSGELTGAPDST